MKVCFYIFSSISTQLSLRNDSLTRSFCSSVEQKPILFPRRDTVEFVQDLSKESSIALSKAAAQYYTSLPRTPLHGVETPLHQDGFIYVEANPDMATPYFDNPEGTQGYEPELTLEEKDLRMKAYRPRPHGPSSTLSPEEITLSPVQQEVLYGLLCGSGSITETKGENGFEYHFSYYDPIEKAPFVESVFKIFSNLCDAAPFVVPNERYPGGGIGFTTIKHSCFEDFYYKFYPVSPEEDDEDRYGHCFEPDNTVILDGERFCPNYMRPDLFTPRALAYWYMSHGVLGKPDESGFKDYGFHCPGHESGSCGEMADEFYYIFNLMSPPTSGPDNSMANFWYKYNYVITIAPCDRLRFKRMILNSIHPSLRYKI